MRICDWLASLGLRALELQMTYGPRTKHQTCIEYRRLAKEADIKLSVHASYFIVFTSDDPIKLRNSRETLKRTYELAMLLDADVIVLHPGPLYGHTDSRATCRRFIDNLGTTLSQLGTSEIGLFVETAGKLGQLGSVDDILAISDQLDGVYPCIDFGHVHARTLGSLQSHQAVAALFERLSMGGWFHSDQRIHFHYTPIDFGPRGEISHKALFDYNNTPRQSALGLFGDENNDLQPGLYYPRVEPIVTGLRRWAHQCTVISETNDTQEEGALALQTGYYSA